MALKTVTSRQIQKLDDLAINKFGIPSLCLMENAGRAVADEARKLLKKVKRPKITVVCGSGNNAGDGFVAARHLNNSGYDVNVILLSDPARFSKDALVNFNIIKKSGIPVKTVKRVTKNLEKHIAASHLVIDAVFGVGLNRKIEGVYLSVIETLNTCAVKILAVDVPAGLDATTGRIFGAAVKAHTTVTMTFAKRGFVKCLGPKFCGKIKVVDIGLPASLKNRI